MVADTIGYSADGPKSVFLSWSIYLDSFAGGYTVTNNVCYRAANGGLMLQGGKDNRVENNIFVDGKFNQMHSTTSPATPRARFSNATSSTTPIPKPRLVLGGKLTPR